MTDPRVGARPPHTPETFQRQNGGLSSDQLPISRAAYPIRSLASRPQSAFMPSTNVNAQAVATSLRYFSLTLSTQPASMTKLSR